MNSFSGRCPRKWRQQKCHHKAGDRINRKGITTPGLAVDKTRILFIRGAEDVIGSHQAKNIPMTTKRNHVKHCSTADCFMVVGISRKAERISVRAAPKPLCSLRLRSNSAMFSGGNSFVVITVQSTQTRKATAPILKA